MSWHFSRALVEEYLVANSLDGVPSALLSGLNTPHLVSSSDKMIEYCLHSPFGMTCKPLTADHGEAMLTWFLEVSPVKTYQQQERGMELTENGQGCGTIWPGSWGKYDPNSSLWKTHQCLLLGGLEEYSETWPKWGSMQNGEFWGLTMPMGLMDGRESGLSLPTPLKSDHMKFLKFKKHSVLKATFGTHVNSIPYWTTANHGKIPSAELITWVMGWPIGWASLKPLEMGKYQQWLHSHGKL